MIFQNILSKMSWTVGNVTVARISNIQPQAYTIVLTLVHDENDEEEEGFLFYPRGGFSFNCWSRPNKDNLPTEYVTSNYSHQVKADQLHIHRDILAQIDDLFKTINA
jgi:hypothetical protein